MHSDKDNSQLWSNFCVRKTKVNLPVLVQIRHVYWNISSNRPHLLHFGSSRGQSWSIWTEFHLETKPAWNMPSAILEQAQCNPTANDYTNCRIIFILTGRKKPAEGPGDSTSIILFYKCTPIIYCTMWIAEVNASTWNINDLEVWERSTQFWAVWWGMLEIN